MLELFQQFFDFVFRVLTNPERLIEFLSTVFTGWYGYALLFAIVFSETGLLVGLFLPGDSLLFTVGVVAGAGQLNVVLIIGLLSAAAIIGDAVGYFLGKNAGPLVYNRPDSRFFKREHLEKTHAFYEKHGGKTIIYARFVPIIRTFAPFVAGVANMTYAKFASFNIFGGIGWVVLVTLLGYYIGNVEIVRHNFEKVLLGIVLISVMPIVFEYVRGRKRA
jgi:membrane-associated protein